VGEQIVTEIKANDEQTELARRISLFLVGETAEECAKLLPKVATFIAKRDAYLDECFVCRAEKNLGQKQFTQSHPITCIDNWFRKQAEWDKESIRLERAIRYEHFLGGSCWCEPVVEGNVVKHNGL
jgi:hypothetical protein